MAPHPVAIWRNDRRGRWLPPKTRNGNVKSPPSAWFRYSNQTHSTQPIDQLPHGARPFKCFSMYHDRAMIWTVGYDATAHAVENGVDSTAAGGNDNDDDDHDDEEEGGSDNSDDEDDRPDWTSLTFAHNGSNHVSYAGPDLAYPRLRARRPDQYWATQLLTDMYSAPATQMTHNPSFGGLNGELPLLLGLLAFHIPANRMIAALPACVAKPWRVYPPPGLARGSGCTCDLVLLRPLEAETDAVARRAGSTRVGCDGLLRPGRDDAAGSRELRAWLLR